MRSGQNSMQNPLKIKRDPESLHLQGSISAFYPSNGDFKDYSSSVITKSSKETLLIMPASSPLHTNSATCPRV